MIKAMMIGLAMSTLLTTRVNVIPQRGTNETIHDMNTDILLKYYDELDAVVEDDYMMFMSREDNFERIYIWSK